MPGAPGGNPHPCESEGEGSGNERRGRPDKRPNKRNKQPREKEKTDEEKYREATEDEIWFSWILGKAIGETTKRPPQPPSGYEQAKPQDIRFWLTSGQHYFSRNLCQWQDEADCIKYVLSKVKGSQVVSFAMTYRNQMTGELRPTRHLGYQL